jgi:hypothetical protein
MPASGSRLHCGGVLVHCSVGAGGWWCRHLLCIERPRARHHCCTWGFMWVAWVVTTTWCGLHMHTYTASSPVPCFCLTDTHALYGSAGVVVSGFLSDCLMPPQRDSRRGVVAAGRVRAAWSTVKSQMEPRTWCGTATYAHRATACVLRMCCCDTAACAA